MLAGRVCSGQRATDHGRRAVGHGALRAQAQTAGLARCVRMQGVAREASAIHKPVAVVPGMQRAGRRVGTGERWLVH